MLRAGVACIGFGLGCAIYIPRSSGGVFIVSFLCIVGIVFALIPDRRRHADVSEAGPSTGVRPEVEELLDPTPSGRHSAAEVVVADSKSAAARPGR